jgi:hypothetical protein
MNIYTITSRTSGQCLGTYSGHTPAEAHEAMAQDAGYSSLADMADRLATTAAALLAEVNIVTVCSVGGAP